MKIKLYKNGNKKNPAILFLHGFPFDHRMWKSQVTFLKKNFYCLSYDILEKWEKAKRPEPMPFEFLVDDLFSILEKERLTDITLCGLSLGGYIILRALERKPEIFSKIILCDTKSEADSNEAKLKRVAGIQSINENGVQTFLKEFATNTLSEITIKAKPKLYKKALKIASARKANSTKSILVAIQGRTDTTSVLPKISVPTLVICGEYDALTPPESMQKLSSQIPQGQFIQVPEAGHLAPFENPKFVNEKILEFLNK